MGSQFVDVVLDFEETLRGSGDDLSNYFYQIANLPVWRRRNCFGRVFTGTDAEAVGGDPCKRYHISLRVVAMGDHNAVDVAQTVHEHILKQRGLHVALS